MINTSCHAKKPSPLNLYPYPNILLNSLYSLHHKLCERTVPLLYASKQHPYINSFRTKRFFLLTRAYPLPTTITALKQPHTLLQFHVFTILQIHRKQANCRSTAPLKPIISLFIAINPFPPTPSILPIPHSNFDAFHNPAFTPPLPLSSPQPPQNPHSS